MELISEAQQAGARLTKVCEVMGVDVRTIQRWRAQGLGDDMRMGPKTRPANQLCQTERKKILTTVNQPEYRDLPVSQIVPRLADKGVYIASESTMHRVLKAAGQDAHRGRKKRKRPTKPKEKFATGTGQLWSWDISYLRSPITGQYFYLYLVLDVWSRKIVGHAVQEVECSELASVWLEETFRKEGRPRSLVIHQDNGAPMKGATLQATLDRLEIGKSYSRPHVSDDNPYSESLFGTAKTRPEYPRAPFANLQAARDWADAFVTWYNEQHRHSAIGFVTPAQRHEGKASTILAKRRCVYQKARKRNPQRWSKNTRQWTSPEIVFLNPDKKTLEMRRN